MNIATSLLIRIQNRLRFNLWQGWRSLTASKRRSCVAQVILSRRHIRYLKVQCLLAWLSKTDDARKTTLVSFTEGRRLLLAAHVVSSRRLRFVMLATVHAWGTVSRKLAASEQAENLYGLLLRLRLYRKAWSALAIFSAKAECCRAERLAQLTLQKAFARKHILWAWEVWLNLSCQTSEASYQSTKRPSSGSISSHIIAC